MDYKEKYEQALEWARSAIQAGADGMLKEDLEHIFPELKESEDEKIRKGVIKSIMDLNTDWLELHGVTKEKALAWLEKQGEQKPVEWTEEDEKMLNKIIKDFERANESWLKGQGSLPFGDRIKWLKSLRPQYSSYREGFKNGFNKAKEMHYDHWKPTEEQLEALFDTFETGVGRVKRDMLLESLYDELKKL